MQSEERAGRMERERKAPRLHTTAPRLEGLFIEVFEYSQIACVKYKKRFHVPSAPALFELRCGDDRCEHGGYDITPTVMLALRLRETRGRGDCSCDGTTGKSLCGRQIHFELFAEYRSA